MLKHSPKVGLIEQIKVISPKFLFFVGKIWVWLKTSSEISI